MIAKEPPEAISRLLTQRYRKPPTPTEIEGVQANV